MKQVEIDYFKEFRFPLNVKAKGNSFAFLARQANMEKNNYETNLWLGSDNSTYSLTSSGDIQNYWFLNEDTIVFTAFRDSKDKTSIEKGHALTVFYRLHLNQAGEATEFLRLPYTLNEVVFIKEDYFIFSAEFDPRQQQIFRKDNPNAEDEWKEEQEYSVFTELPFWANGSGVIDKKRVRLYLFNKGEITSITDEITSVETLRLNHTQDKLYYIAQSYTTKAPIENQLFELDLSTLSIKEISIEKPFNHTSFTIMENGNLVVFGSNNQEYGINQNGDFYRLNPSTGFSQLIYSDQQYSGWDSTNSDLKMSAGCKWFSTDDWMYWIDTIGGESHIMRIHQVTGEITQVTNVPGSVMEICSYKNKILFTAMRGLAGPEIYILEENDERQLTNLNIHCQEEYVLATPEKLVFENSEGATISGWVLPPAKQESTEDNGVPAILCIHGGPKTVYGSVLFHEMQYWSAQGYAVIFCNPTGSDGHGAQFSDIRGRYGLIDYEDIMMFVDEVLVQYDWIDGDRLAVTGGSYGGYMTNWIIGHTNRFRAAASQRSIASWISMATTTDIGYFFAPDQAGADIWSDVTALWEQSPLKYADKVTTPTLFLHSDEDYRCWMSEAIQMYTALQIHNVETRLCLFHGENHELSRSGKPRHRVRRLQEITTWFDTYLKNGYIASQEEEKCIN